MGASDADILRLARCYWFSVEFGLVHESGSLKAYGAGLLSSPGELTYACEAKQAELLDWDPDVAASVDYPITDFQPRYFVAKSLQAGKQAMQRFAEQLPRPFYARYNDASQRIWVDRAVALQPSATR